VFKYPPQQARHLSSQSQSQPVKNTRLGNLNPNFNKNGQNDKENNENWINNNNDDNNNGVSPRQTREKS
jgi:hypothetical protein